jgi:hypothetical protein
MDTSQQLKAIKDRKGVPLLMKIMKPKLLVPRTDRTLRRWIEEGIEGANVEPTLADALTEFMEQNPDIQLN